METCFVARDNSGVLTVKLWRETSLVAYSTDKRSTCPGMGSFLRRRCLGSSHSLLRRGSFSGETASKRGKERNNGEIKSKGSVSQLMDDLDLINSVEQVEVMVNSIQKGAENQKTSTLVMLENLLSVFLICSALFRSKSNLHEYAARLRGASTR